jgi:hypothetical protein
MPSGERQPGGELPLLQRQLAAVDLEGDQRVGVGLFAVEVLSTAPELCATRLHFRNPARPQRATFDEFRGF